MGRINEVVNVQIDIKDRVIQYEGFGILAILDKFASNDTNVVKTGVNFTERTREYLSIEDVDDDFQTTSDVYKAMSIAFSQERKPTKVMVLRADPVDTDMTESLEAIVDENNRWYGLANLTRVKQDNIDIAEFIEARSKIFLLQSSEADILTSATTDIAYQIKANNYHRTAVMYHHSDTEFADVALLAARLTRSPGTETWKFVNLTGVTASELTASELTATQKSNTLGKNANIYETLYNVTESEGFNITREGTMGSGRFIDITRTVDYIEANLETAVFNLLINNPKVPYTDAGIASVGSVINKFLLQAERDEIIANNPKFVVSIPTLSETTGADRAARKLTNVKFAARLSGAIHNIDIIGTLTL